MFKIGDKVKIVNNFEGDEFNKYIGTIATIISDHRLTGRYILNIIDDGYTIWSDEEFVKLERKEKLKRLLCSE